MSPYELLYNFAPKIEGIFMFIGYARISTEEQNLHMQEDALKSAGCEEVFTEVASGAKSQRLGLDKALSYLREGDTLVVWKLDRLGRSWGSSSLARKCQDYLLSNDY